MVRKVVDWGEDSGCRLVCEGREREREGEKEGENKKEGERENGDEKIGEGERVKYSKTVNTVK